MEANAGANVKFIRKDLGGGYCVHVDVKEGRVGLSRRQGDTPPSRPPDAEVWLDESKLRALCEIAERVGSARGVVEKPAVRTPRAISATPFFQANFERILRHRQGRMQNPPWWLRWLYSAVVTKEEYGED